ncbi:Phox homologous domain-containing protein [Ochromonadaceae sp. CCMP2298]|nr:Phox homologous domain-containing protein [Ochromonadaceae sp. CCMP2298]|mmetsp:Transcript_20092/g.44668  ORF Transcript_20092/g.44668 Transcript_20092/m.44668 type:complete len:152 (+) Transcript_20092:175-630(+)
MDASSKDLLYFPLKQFSSRFGENIFTINIGDYERMDSIKSCAGSFVVYHIAVSRGKSSWIVRKRFSEFDLFRSYLVSSYPNVTQQFPPLPAKTLLSVAKDDAFLAERQEQLMSFMDNTLKSLHLEKLLEDPKLADFLEFSSHRILSTPQVI